MRAHEAARPPMARKIRSRVGAAVLLATLLAACEGENLFTSVGAFTGLLGPNVVINAPQSGLGLAVGDSLLVTAQVSSPDGVTQVSYTGVFQGGGTAFVAQLVTLPNAQDTIISRYLQQSGTATGVASIIVQATDLVGAMSADTVSVIISP